MIEKRTVLSQMEVLPNGTVQLRLEKQIVENGQILARPEYHRTSFEPGDDVDEQMARVNAHLVQMGAAAAAEEVAQRVKRITAVEHTTEVVQKHRERVAAAQRELAAGRKPG